MKDLSTELPMLVRTLVARSIRSLPMLTLNARVMWLQNSTLIPTSTKRVKSRWENKDEGLPP